MVNTEVSTDTRLPRWLAWYLNIDLAGKEKRERRHQFALNIVALGAFCSASFYVLVYLLYDLRLWPTAFGTAINSIIFVSLPFIYRRSATWTFFWGAIFASLNIVFLTYLMGSATGIFLLLLIVPAVVLLIFGPSRRDFLVISSLTSLAGTVFCVWFTSEPALSAASDALLQKGLMTTSVLSVLLLVVIPSYLGFLRAEVAEDALEAEHARSEALLYNLLPEDIAARLKVEPDQTIADSLPKVAILFADIVDFTPRAASLPPEEVVGFLNKIFRAFDELAEKHGLEKIKTIGDAYMVAAGMPNPCGDPVHRVAEMALDMQSAVEAMAPDFPEGLQVRIGLHAGPAVAGVIGNRKLFYDVWGETVNTASRMESHGEPGRIQVTTAAKEELEDTYEFEQRGTVEVKGIGALETWWLDGAKA
ncbi:adenylate/guanylate cyclase domain-containing protein [Aestuariivita boseongensis]|uniref:adenylate/guanylate cyclase domain-containing protein n=1 Tax=Aestuariivita boseongensis TaxID=1470562 RepID=UPI0006817815|nr:adenylate/guanylate cyclase domain-containing protein [Aestuariivita boseongensis]